MTYQILAVKRAIKGEKVRHEGKLPAVLYGAGGETVSLSLNPIEFGKLYRQAGDSSLIDLTVDGKEVGKVLVQEAQYDPVSDVIIHVDFRRIDMNKEMTAPVALHFIGESPIIKSSGGTLVATLHQVTVKCLPKDLVSHIDIDISTLISYDVVVKVKDLKLPSGVVITSPNAEDLVVKATRALTEEEIKAMEEASKAPTDLSKIEVSGKKKEEEGEVAEGEEGKPADADKAAAPAEKKEEKK